MYNLIDPLYSSLISNPNLHPLRLLVSMTGSMIPLFMEEIRRLGG